jgi:MFS family permease
MIGRLIAGLAIGIGSVTAPLYIAEIAPKNNRGTLVSLNQLMIVVGIFSSFIVSYIYSESSGWREMFTIAFIPAALQLAGLFFIPESPAWLIGQGKTSATDKKKGGSFRALFSPEIRPLFLIGVGISVIQQVTGINTVFYYAPHIFQLAGYTSAASSIYATTWLGIFNLLMTIVGLKIIDKVQRRTLLLMSLGGMALSLLILGITFLAFAVDAGIMAVVSLLVYIASFAIGMGMIPWLIISEIYPLEIRGRGMGFAVLANWAANYLVTLTFLPLVQTIGIGCSYCLFTVICLLSMWFTWKKVPETASTIE